MFRQLLPVLLVLTLCASSQVMAQTITGIVISPEAEPIAGANVVVSDRSSGVFVAGTTTSANGVFSVPALYAGSFSVVVSYVGRQQHAVIVDVEKDIDSRITIVLDPATIVQEEMVITAKRFERSISPATHTNLTARELANRSSMKDLPVHLATTPSITFYSENGNGIGYSTLRMRGFDQRRIAIAINGIPQNDPEEFNVFWINFYDIQGVVRDVLGIRELFEGVEHVGHQGEGPAHVRPLAADRRYPVGADADVIGAFAGGVAGLGFIEGQGVEAQAPGEQVDR